MAKKKKRDQHDVLDSRFLAARISKAKQFDAGSPLLFSVPEAAAKLRIGLSKMWQMVWQEKIPRIIIGRQTRIRAQDVYDYLKEFQSHPGRKSHHRRRQHHRRHHAKSWLERTTND